MNEAGTGREEAMTPRRRRWLTVAFCAFFIVQLAQVLTPVMPALKLWPFCPYNLFAFRINLREVQYFQVILREDDGVTQTVAPGHVVPMEFFRANGILINVFWLGKDKARQDAIARTLLDHLNKHPWPEFDETYPAARPRPGHRFVGLDIVGAVWDFADYRYAEPFPPKQTLVLFSYHVEPSS
jgi:hypothetical protein